MGWVQSPRFGRLIAREETYLDGGTWVVSYGAGRFENESSKFAKLILLFPRWEATAGKPLAGLGGQGSCGRQTINLRTTGLIALMPTSLSTIQTYILLLQKDMPQHMYVRNLRD